MSDPLTWPAWVQTLLVAVLLLGVALAWFTTGWGALLVIVADVLIAIYLHSKNSN